MSRSISRVLLLLAVTAAALTVVLSPEIRAAHAQTSAVQIRGFAFLPPTVTIPLGATVTWANQDSVAHTSTSDAADSVHWNSGSIAAGHSYSFTFNQAGTFTYHCMIHPFMTGTITVQSAGTAPSPTATGITSVIPATATPITLRAYPVKARVGAGQMMGASRPVSQPSWQGFYDGHKDTYLSTDVSSKAMATSMHVNFSPGLAHMSMAFTDPMYLVEGRAAANQIAVFGSQPGEADYSPLWHEVVVRWKAGTHAVLLTSDNQIISLQKKGKLTLQQNHVILNCPIVKI